MIIAPFIFLVFGLLLTLFGVAIVGFDVYMMSGSNLKLLTNYDFLYIWLKSDGIRALQTQIQNTFGNEVWADYMEPFLTHVPAFVTFLVPGLLFLLVGFKSLPKKIIQDKNAPKSTTEMLHRAQMKAGDRRF